MTAAPAWRSKAAGEPVAQVVEHETFNLGVVGSSPTGLTINILSGPVSGLARGRRYSLAWRSTEPGTSPTCACFPLMSGPPESNPSDRDETRCLQRYLRIIRDFGRVALDSLDVAVLLRRCVGEVSRGTGIRRVKIMRFRKNQGDLLVEAGIGWNPGVVGKARFGIDIASPAGRAWQTGEPVVIEDIRQNFEYRIHPVLAEHGIVSLANVPVSFNSKSWGVLEADSEQSQQFRSIDLEFLHAMAALLSGALQRADAETRLEAATAQAAVRLERQTMLFNELQHRTKNNFQIVVSMLAQERRAVMGQSAAERFGRAIDRVTAIALAHDRLSYSGAETETAGSATDLHGYLTALLSALELSFGPRIGVERELDHCMLPLDKAVAVGLATNELITNAAKHAYAEDESGVVRVSLSCDATRTEGTLTIADDGKGMNAMAHADQRNERTGHGLDLVLLLARQLGGDVEQQAQEQGTKISLRFPLVM